MGQWHFSGTVKLISSPVDSVGAFQRSTTLDILRRWWGDLPPRAEVTRQDPKKNTSQLCTTVDQAFAVLGSHSVGLLGIYTAGTPFKRGCCRLRACSDS